MSEVTPTPKLMAALTTGTTVVAPSYIQHLLSLPLDQTFEVGIPNLFTAAHVVVVVVVRSRALAWLFLECHRARFWFGGCTRRGPAEHSDMFMAQDGLPAVMEEHCPKVGSWVHECGFSPLVYHGECYPECSSEKNHPV